MKDLFDNLFSLSIGAVVSSKEQVEKLVDELVEKGKMTRNESSDLIKNLIQKGEQAQDKIESTIKERIDEALNELNIATLKDINELKQRISLLEKQLADLDK